MRTLCQISYPSCPVCRKPIPKGTSIDWEAGKRVTHWTCSAQGKSELESELGSRNVALDPATVSPEAIARVRTLAPAGKAFLPYQEAGIAETLTRLTHPTYPRGVLLGDEMGLGKTVQAIAIINGLVQINLAVPKRVYVLVVCPKSLVCNWHNEIDRWVQYHGVIYVTSYEQLVHYGSPLDTIKARQNPDELNDLLIVDEGQYIKNSVTKRYHAVARFAAQARYRLILTGTPITNRVKDLWSLLQLLDPTTWDPPGVVSKKNEAGEWVKSRVGAGQGAGWESFGRSYCGAKRDIIGRIGKGPNAPLRYAWNYRGASNLDD